MGVGPHRQADTAPERLDRDGTVSFHTQMMVAPLARHTYPALTPTCIHPLHPVLGAPSSSLSQL